ncbi:unnamed protein product [Aureobasidium pullulans]|nr:unnamed protein product [Aureobasidium pullulans]
MITLIAFDLDSILAESKEAIKSDIAEALSELLAVAYQLVYAELFSEQERLNIIKAFELSLSATGSTPEQTWGDRIEDRGSQITFSALGQQAPVREKEHWDPDFAKRKVIQADLRTRLPGLSINMGGTTSIDIT